jgi:multiple sugar transport system permease protein
MRPYADTSLHGYVSWPHHFNFDNFKNAYTQADLPHYFFNSLIVALPAIVLILLLSSSLAFVVSRLSYWWNVPLLIFFMAANLLPQQVILQPLYRLYLRVPLPTWLSDSGYLYDSYVGLILINVAFQIGFCTFVLSNYMKTIPRSLNEAARVDGAGVFRQFWQVILPLCKPALAALATLEFTFIYNDFLWALILIQNGSKRPITAALNNLQGEFFTDNNLLAAGALLTAIPTLLVFAVLQRQFVNGLTLGAKKG